MVEDFDGVLSRLRLGAIREQLDGLLKEAGRRQLHLREALAWLTAAEVASKEQRRLSMAMTIAHLPFLRTLEGFEFEAQPSIDLVICAGTGSRAPVIPADLPPLLPGQCVDHLQPAR